MNNRYNYYPSNNYNRMNYNEFMNSLGIDNNMNVNLVQNNLIYLGEFWAEFPKMVGV